MYTGWKLGSKMELLAAALLLPGLAFGQWLDYPTPGVPHAANGKANLMAPAPRRGGKPDLSGIWQLEPAPCAPNGVTACGSDYVGGREFGNIGARIPGGLPYLPWAAELVKKRTADLGKDDPVASCKPSGALRLLTYPPYRKILQMPQLVVIRSERDVTYRQIFTDGRPLPKDPSPTWNGYSTGKWQGDALVVETTGFRDGAWLDRAGSPMMEGARMTERFRRVNFGNLEIEVTIDDPKSDTRSWTALLHQMIVLISDLLYYFCQDNEKDVSHIVGK